MAKVAAVPPPGDESVAPKKSKLKLIIAILAVVVLLAGGAAAYLLVLAPGGESAEEAAVVNEPLPPPVFSKLDPFVVNLAKPDENRYLQVGITYELTDNVAVDEIKNFTPVIRSRILMVLSSKNVDSLSNI
ncbi:MAG: flagellar basal body-associated FliL family protein, partial [Limnobacter sp.]|nr:flagellar basal body-associated FliL family protein [Limnobacter sp.]